MRVKQEFIRLLVVDDSDTIRLTVRKGLHAVNPNILVIGEAKNGQEAVQQALALKPDVILMDIKMPVMDGIQATREIMSRLQIPILIFTGSQDPEKVDTDSLNAIQAGAMMIFKKPATFGKTSTLSEFKNLSRLITSMAQIKVNYRDQVAQSQAVTRQLSPSSEQDRMVFIGASTGGPSILAAILHELPGNFPYPILIAQHMSEGFVENFARWLDSETKLTVKIARDQEIPLPGIIYLAPKCSHMGLYENREIAIAPNLTLKKVCPSVDHLFHHASQVLKEKAVAILLTGMGKDGAKGLRMVRDAGGTTIAQDEQSCIVYGMPKAAVNMQAAQQQMTPEEITTLLQSLCQK